MKTIATVLSLFVCFIGLTQLTVPISNGLVGYYPLNETAQDHSGNNYHGSANNVTYDFDYFGEEKCGNFTADDSYINVGDIDAFEGTNELSVCFLDENGFQRRRCWK
jgi:hypothetical protein